MQLKIYIFANADRNLSVGWYYPPFSRLGPDGIDWIMLHLYSLYKSWFDFVSVAAAFNPDQPISMEFLQHLVQLTDFVTLMPRFTASVPSSWVEVQQDQQRLHQHTLVDPVLHTRTWKVRSDGSRYV